MYSWGKGDEGQLGRRVASEKLPHIIESLSGQDVQQVAAGASHTLFVTGIYFCYSGASSLLNLTPAFQAKVVSSHVARTLRARYDFLFSN